LPLPINPNTGSPIPEGARIVACPKCGTIHPQSLWISVGNKCCAGYCQYEGNPIDAGVSWDSPNAWNQPAGIVKLGPIGVSPKTEVPPAKVPPNVETTKDRKESLIKSLIYFVFSFLGMMGVYFLGQKFYPDFILFRNFEWPMIIIGIGYLLLANGLLTHQAAIAIPGAIVAFIGDVLYSQNVLDPVESWYAFSWFFLPGLCGIGFVEAGIFGYNRSPSIRYGLKLILVDVMLLAIISHFSGYLWGTVLLAVLLIALGVRLIVKTLLHR